MSAEAETATSPAPQLAQSAVSRPVTHLIQGRAKPFIWLGAAAVLFLCFSYLAFRREPWPGAFGISLSARWWGTLLPSSLPQGLPAYNVRFNSVAALPGTNTFVAVGTGGAIVRSPDGGKTWGPIIWTGQSSDLLGGVSFADANTGWAVGYGGTIIRLEDGGAILHRQLSGTSKNLYSVKAVSPAFVVAVGEKGLIFTTDNGGRTWRQSHSGVDQALLSVDFATPKDGLVVGNSGVILRTADGGNTWSKVDLGFQPHLTCVKFYGPKTAWATGQGGTVLRSTDAGQTWSRIDTPTPKDLQSIVPLGDSSAIAVGDSVLLSTTDASHWTQKVNPLNSRLTSVDTSSSGARVAVGYAGSILISDGQEAWQPKTMGAAGLLEDIVYSPAGFWIAGNDGQLLASDPNGRSFQTRLFRSGGTWVKLSFTPDGVHGIAFGFYGELVRTDDGGHSWRDLAKVKDTNVRDGVLIDESHLWVAGNKLWRSTDGRATWESPEGAPALPEVIAFANSKRGVVAKYPGQFFVTDDGGETWEASIVEPADVVTQFAPVRIVYIDSDHAWAVGTDGIILHSGDGGRHWAAQDTGQHIEFDDIAFRKDGMHGWVVGGDGFFGSTANGGTAWSFTKVRDHVLSAVSFRDPDHGAAVGWDGKIIQTSDGGKTWTDYEQPWWPSPWYYFSWLLVALVGAPAFRRPPPERSAEPTIANKLVSDRPLEAGEEDALGLSKVARGLSRFLRNENTVPPLTVAITGEWGSGKSSLMNLLAASLRDNGFRPVFFNAWHNQQEQSVLASLFEAIRKSSLPSIATVEGLLFRSTLLLRRSIRRWRLLLFIGILLAASAGLLEARPLWLQDLWESFMRSAPGFIQALTAPAGKDNTPAWLAFLASAAAALGFLAKGLKAFGIKPKEILAQTTEGSTRKPYHLRFAGQFHDVAAALAPRRMVIFVDDLDRCRPQYVLDTLEAINFLVSSGECFVVMGLAPEQVKAAVGLAFKEVAEEMVKLQSGTPAAEGGGAGEGDSKDEQSRRKREEYARQYMYKLINMEIPVPQVGSEGAENVLAGKGVETRTQSGVLALLKPYAVVVALLAVLIGAFFGAQQVAAEIQAAVEARKVQQDPVGPVKAAASPGAAKTGPAGTAAKQPAAPDAIANTGQPPGFVPASPVPHHPIRYLAIAPFVALWIAAAAWILRLRISVIVRDSADFTQALEEWQPVLSQMFRTPRALKRFLNKVRYLAMLQRIEPPEHTVWAALIRRFSPSQDRNMQQIAPGALSETALVALAAIDEASGLPGVQGVEQCKSDHIGKFGDALDAADKARYQQLTQGLKVG